MSKSHSVKNTTLMVRMDQKSKEVLVRAAELRGVSVSDYVRTVTVPQAQQELSSAAERIIGMSPSEQLAFWQALEAPVKLTPAQRRLGKIMRGEV